MNKGLIITGVAALAIGAAWYFSQKNDTKAGGTNDFIDNTTTAPGPGPNPYTEPTTPEPSAPKSAPSIGLGGNQRGRVVSVNTREQTLIANQIRSGERTAGTVLLKNDKGQVVGGYDSDRAVSFAGTAAGKPTAAAVVASKREVIQKNPVLSTTARLINLARSSQSARVKR